MICAIRVSIILTACAVISVTQINAQTQTEMNATAREHFARADADLNKTYQAVLKKVPDAESKQKLKEAQRAWIASRDAEATRAADEVRGGSMAPTLRYETMTELTRQRIKQLEPMLTSNAAPDEKDASTPSPTPTATSSASAQESDKEPAAAAPNPSSVSPDKQWEYKCDEYGLDQCAPEIVKAGTTEVVLDLDQELGVSGPDAKQTEVIWALDSKRLACNYSPPHAHHTTFQSVAFYQLRGDKWLALHSPADEASERAQLAQLGKGHLPKDFNLRRCVPDRDVLKLCNWTDANTAILYAPCYGRTSGELEVGFLFTLKFDAAGNWKIVKTHRMSAKEIEKEAGEQ
jgi:uncharacterized protein YecT (DUF1311 family)